VPQAQPAPRVDRRRVQAAVENWSLPAETEYSLANVSSGQALKPSAALGKEVVSEGDVLEVQPVLVAG